MYYIVVIVFLYGATEPPVPRLVAQHKTLQDCLSELVEVAKMPEFNRSISPVFGKSVVKETPEGRTAAFCVRDMRSI